MKYSSYRELLDPHRYVFTTVPCPGCNQTAEITVDAEALFKYHQGTHVQDAFPELPAGDRERLFLSGICDPCFRALFADEMDEEVNHENNRPT
jgi:hypothetical protein